ncbi:hypothetical protein V8F06_006933 [Rhypophila decipiens]
MRGGRRAAVLPPALLALVFASVAQASTIDFGFYPKDAQECLYKAADDAHCDSGTVETTNNCLCANGGNFVTKTAECLGKSDKKDLTEVYLTMKEACAESNTPLAVMEEQYLANAGTPEKTLTSIVPTPTQSSSQTKDATSSATSTSGPGSGNDKETEDAKPGDKDNSKVGHKEDETKSGGSGMSTGAKAGIIAGGVVGGLAALGALAFFIFRYRRSRYSEESHPMLPPENGHMSLVPTAAETGALMAVDTPKGDWPNDAKWRPSNGADERKSGFNWESPYDLAYPGLLKPGQTPSPPGRSAVFELQGSNQQPVEAPSEPLGAGDGPLVIPVPRASAGSNRYSGSDWTEISAEGRTPTRSRANSSR